MIIGVNEQNSATDKSSGYTVVETMLFLVISGVILATSLLFFKGRQERIQFTQGTREIEAQLKTTMNEVTSGYYPNKGDFSCSEGSEGPVLNFSGSNELGTNENCIFIGKMLKFASNGYDAYSVLGLRRNNTTIANSLEASKPVVSENIKESFKFPWGITVTKVVSFKGATNAEKSSVGVLTSIGTFSDDDGDGSFDIAAGSQTANLLPIGTALGDSYETFSDNVEAMTDADSRPSKVYICLESGGGDRKATIILGGNDKQLNTELVIDSNFPECEDA